MHKESTVIKEITKRKNVVVRFIKGRLGGYDYAEIRQYESVGRGDFQPTLKGITFKPDLLDDMIEGLKALKRALGRDDSPQKKP